MLVRGRVDKEFGGAEERAFEGARNGEEEQDVDVSWDGERGDDGFRRGGLQSEFFC